LVLSRVFRLYPAYWVSLPILTFVSFHIGLRPGLDTILANVTMMQSLGGWGNIDPVFWTLAIELIFYVSCFILCWRNLLSDPTLIGTIVLLTLTAAIAPALVGQVSGSRLPVVRLAFFVAMFFMGMLLRFVFVDGSKSARVWACILVPVVMLEGLAMGGAFFPVPENSDILLPPAVLCPSMALPILLFVAVLWIEPVPGRIVMYLGTISYSLYLFQDIGLRLLPDAISPGASPLAYVIAAMAVTILVASIVYRWVERPAIAIGRGVISASDLATRSELSPV
jgi:peptidoglycan/LPS O-acetylase OafA/YrhL